MQDDKRKVFREAMLAISEKEFLSHKKTLRVKLLWGKYNPQVQSQKVLKQ